MTATQEVQVDVRMRTDPLRAQMLALAYMYEQAAAAMRAGIARLDRLDDTEDNE